MKKVLVILLFLSVFVSYGQKGINRPLRNFSIQEYSQNPAIAGTQPNKASIAYVPTEKRFYFNDGLGNTTWQELDVVTKGLYQGKSSTYATAPTTTEINNFFILDTDDVGTGTAEKPQYPKGIYAWDGTNYVIQTTFEKQSLFKNRVDNLAGLKAIPTPTDGETRQVGDGSSELSFMTFNSNAVGGEAPDDGTVGFWQSAIEGRTYYMAKPTHNNTSDFTPLASDATNSKNITVVGGKIVIPSDGMYRVSFQDGYRNMDANVTDNWVQLILNDGSTSGVASAIGYSPNDVAALFRQDLAYNSDWTNFTYERTLFLKKDTQIDFESNTDTQLDGGNYAMCHVEKNIGVINPRVVADFTDLDVISSTSTKRGLVTPKQLWTYFSDKPHIYVDIATATGKTIPREKFVIVGVGNAKSVWYNHTTSDAVFSPYSTDFTRIFDKTEEGFHYLAVNEVISAPFPTGKADGTLALTDDLTNVYVSRNGTFTSDFDNTLFRDGMNIYVKSTNAYYIWDKATAKFVIKTSDAGLPKKGILDAGNPLNGEGIYTVEIANVTIPVATGSQNRYVLLNKVASGSTVTDSVTFNEDVITDEGSGHNAMGWTTTGAIHVGGSNKGIRTKTFDTAIDITVDNTSAYTTYVDILQDDDTLISHVEIAAHTQTVYTVDAGNYMERWGNNGVTWGAGGSVVTGGAGSLSVTDGTTTWTSSITDEVLYFVDESAGKWSVIKGGDNKEKTIAIKGTYETYGAIPQDDYVENDIVFVRTYSNYHSPGFWKKDNTNFKAYHLFTNHTAPNIAHDFWGVKDLGTLNATETLQFETLRTHSYKDLKEWTERHPTKLRGNIVETEAELKALKAKQYEKRRVRATKKEYVFFVTADLTAEEIADVSNLSDDADTGKWVYEVSKAKMVNTVTATFTGGTVDKGQTTKELYEQVSGFLARVDLPTGKILDLAMNNANVTIVDATEGTMYLQQVKDGGDFTVAIQILDVPSPNRQTIVMNLGGDDAAVTYTFSANNPSKITIYGLSSNGTKIPLDIDFRYLKDIGAKVKLCIVGSNEWSNVPDYDEIFQFRFEALYISDNQIEITPKWAGFSEGETIVDRSSNNSSYIMTDMVVTWDNLSTTLKYPEPGIEYTTGETYNGKIIYRQGFRISHADHVLISSGVDEYFGFEGRYSYNGGYIRSFNYPKSQHTVGELYSNGGVLRFRKIDDVSPVDWVDVWVDYTKQ